MLVTDRQRADATRKDGRAEWLQEKVLADVDQAAAQEGAHARTPRDHRRRSEMMDAEDHAQGRGTGCRGKTFIVRSLLALPISHDLYFVPSPRVASCRSRGSIPDHQKALWPLAKYSENYLCRMQERPTDRDQT